MNEYKPKIHAMLNRDNVDWRGRDKFAAYCRFSELWNSQGGCCIYMAMSLWKDAFDLLEEHLMYKRQVKMLAKRLDGMWDNLLALMRKAFGDKWNVYIDSLIQMYGSLEQDLLFLYLAHKRVLDRQHVADSEFVARQQMALIMTKQASYVFKRFWSMKDKGTDIKGYYSESFKHYFSYEDPTPMYRLNAQLCDLTCPADGEDINFGADVNCVNALSCLMRKALSEEFLAENIIKGVRLQGGEYQDIVDAYERLKADDEAKKRAESERKEQERITAQEEQDNALIAKLSGKYKVSKHKKKI